MKNLYDLDLLIPLILLRGKLKGAKEGIGRFQMTKIVAWIFADSGISFVQKNVFLYRYGPYVLKFEDALAELVKRNIIKVETDNNRQTLLCITDEGQRWVTARLRDEKNSKGDTLVRGIDRCLFIPISDLMMEIAEKSPLLNPIKRKIGNKILIKVFDWRNFGDGKVHGYHYTLLRSFYGLEDYFDNRRNEVEKKIEKGYEDYRFIIVDYSTIPGKRYLDELLGTIKKKHTIRRIFHKRDPRSIKEDKFEGKNYIGHLW